MRNWSLKHRGRRQANKGEKLKVPIGYVAEARTKQGKLHVCRHSRNRPVKAVYGDADHAFRTDGLVAAPGVPAAAHPDGSLSRCRSQTDPRHAGRVSSSSVLAENMIDCDRPSGEHTAGQLQEENLLRRRTEYPVSSEKRLRFMSWSSQSGPERTSIRIKPQRQRQIRSNRSDYDRLGTFKQSNLAYFAAQP